MRSIFPLWPLAVLVLLLGQGCSMSELLRDHRQDIEALMAKDMTPEARFHGLATELAQVLGEATDLNRPDQTLKYLRKFSKQNSRNLRLLYSELSPWVESKNTVEKITFAGRVLMQPYARDLLRLVPKVQTMAEQQTYELGPLDKILLFYQFKRFQGLK
jgi:hypothetical protein